MAPLRQIGLDENGDPMIAFEWQDPNGDGNYSDTDVRFVRWNRVTRKWLPAVQAQVVGEILSQGVNPISIACDRKTGLFAIVTPVGEKGASVVLSKDGGATWSGTPIPGITTTVNSTALAIVDGTAHLVVASTESEAYYLTGPAENVSSWKRESLPLTSGWKREGNANVGLAIDAYRQARCRLVRGAGRRRRATVSGVETRAARRRRLSRPQGAPTIPTSPSRRAGPRQACCSRRHWMRKMRTTACGTRSQATVLHGRSRRSCQLTGRARLTRRST